jgi:D-alanyl-lipoteichoic acid acyltransferase DltB (MBOAT superfamily)
MNRLIDLLTFDPKHVITMAQANFWILFAVVFFIYSLIYKRTRIRTAYLILVSLFFYYKSSGFFVGVLAFTTIYNYFIGLTVAKHRLNKPKAAQTWMVIGIVINVLILCYFKYMYFFTDIYNGLVGGNARVFDILAFTGNGFQQYGYFNVDSIIMPLGISFYTFKTIAYLVEVKKGEIEAVRSFSDFSFFVTFFPSLVQGPIMRGKDFIPQINAKLQVTKEQFGTGVYLFLKGMIKKMILADYIAVHFLNKVFEDPETYSGMTNIFALMGYSLQVYADFAGYTDMAIGVALLMGYKLSHNFNEPYKAVSVGDFWKRWHITLSSWLKDFIYIPLGGNRTGSIGSWIIVGLSLVFCMFAIDDHIVLSIIMGSFIFMFFLIIVYEPFRFHFNRNINLMLTMLIGGLWHGASWNFVIWGGLNGIGILVYKYWSKISPYEKVNHWLIIGFKIIVTWLFITYTRLYFRMPDLDSTMLWYGQVLNDLNLNFKAIGILWEYFQWPVIVILLGYALHWTPTKAKGWIQGTFIKSPIWVKGLAAVLITFICYQTYSADFVAFIYMSF